MPRLVQRAKDIKLKIDASEVIGYISLNDNVDKDEDNESSASNSTSLNGTNLTDRNGTLRRPETKRRKTESLQDAITSLGEQQIVSANIMATALANMVDRLCSNTSHPDAVMKAKVDSIESKLDYILEKLAK